MNEQPYEMKNKLTRQIYINGHLLVDFRDICNNKLFGVFHFIVLFLFIFIFYFHR